MGQNFKLVVFLVGTLLFLALSCGTAIKDQPTEIPGELLFKTHCALCHGITGDKQLSGAKKLTESELSIDEIKMLVTLGKRQMPAFNNRLTTEDIELISAYVFQFRNSK